MGYSNDFMRTAFRGKLSDKRFRKLSADYESEQHELEIQVEVLRKDVEAAEGQRANVDKFLSIVNKYTDIPKLPPPLSSMNS